MATLQTERPQISIAIDGDDLTVCNGRIGSFSTLDTIKGEVSIVGVSDIRFDDIQITFEGRPHIIILTAHVQSNNPSFTGQQRTWMDRFSTSPGMSGQNTSKITVCKSPTKTDIL